MHIRDGIIELLRFTAWRMDTPQIGGVFHVIAVLFIVLAAMTAAWKAAHLESDEVRIWILGVLGWILLAGEVYKQLFYYFIVNDGEYDWWFFPFQLCSVPMYLCILLPFMEKGHFRDSILTFLCGFTFVSAVAALIWPEDMLRPYLALTWHGLIWHGILLFISLMIGLSGMADLSFKGFLRSAGLFLVLCLIAFIINVIAEPIAMSHPVYTTGGIVSYPNMFYISPYHASYQPVVSTIDALYGRPAAIVAYIAGIIALAGIIDYCFKLICCRSSRGENND